MAQQLEPWRPWPGLATSWRELEERMDRLFAELIGRTTPMAAAAPVEMPWRPAIEMFERDGKLIARVDLPGMKREEIKISASDHLLTISGERKVEAETKGATYYRCERAYGSFQRAIALPEDVDTGKITATYKDGVLEITLPKAKGSKTKTIPIQ
jgi:HSP20 family protein